MEQETITIIFAQLALAYQRAGQKLQETAAVCASQKLHNDAHSLYAVATQTYALADEFNKIAKEIHNAANSDHST